MKMYPGRLRPEHLTLGKPAASRRDYWGLVEKNGKTQEMSITFFKILPLGDCFRVTDSWEVADVLCLVCESPVLSSGTQSSQGPNRPIRSKFSWNCLGPDFGSKVLKMSIKSNVHISKPNRQWMSLTMKVEITRFGAYLICCFSFVHLIQVIALFLSLDWFSCFSTQCLCESQIIFLHGCGNHEVAPY